MDLVNDVTRWPATRTELMDVDRLIPYARNARVHSPAQITQVAKSIQEWGFTVPLLIDEQGELIAGHCRLQAAKMLGLARVPVMTAQGWSAAQKRAYIIADNQLALTASWDEQLLSEELAALTTDAFETALIGFTDAELSRMIYGEQAGEDEAPPLPATPITAPGELILLGAHRLLCGDSTRPEDVARLLADRRPHLMVTDPPYGVEYDPTWRDTLDDMTLARGKVVNDAKSDWRAAWELFPGAVAYVWHAGLFASEVQQSLASCGLEVRSQIIWVKPHFAISRGHYHVQHEPCLYTVRKGATGHWNGSRKESTVWQIDNALFQGGKRTAEDASSGHGTQKPVECMRRPILNNAATGDAVYDPFGGSGTTIIACETTGRECLMMEIDPGYCDVVVARWEQFTGGKAIRGASQ